MNEQTTLGVTGMLRKQKYVGTVYSVFNILSLRKNKLSLYLMIY